MVVVPPPRLDHHLRLGPRTEPCEAEAFVAELAVEALAHPVLPGLARIDQCRADPGPRDPAQQRARDELRAVVRAQERRRAAFADQSRQHLDHPCRAQPCIDRAPPARSCAPPRRPSRPPASAPRRPTPTATSPSTPMTLSTGCRR